MRIATSNLFDRPASLMASLTQKADALQAQIASGKKFTAPSQDVTGYARLQALGRADADDAAFAGNVSLAQGLLAHADGTLGSIGTQLQQAQELTIQAANGTLSPENRIAIGAALGAIVDELLALANTKDVRGQPMFGGAAGDVAYAKNPDGSIAFAGSGEPSAIPIGNGDAVSASISGDRAFGAMFATLQALGDALSTGGEVPADALDKLKAASDGVTAARASIGARAVRLDLVAERLTDTMLVRDDARTAIESTDIATTLTELQKTLTILQATQASFAKLSGMSLFDHLR